MRRNYGRKGRSRFHKKSYKKGRGKGRRIKSVTMSRGGIRL